LPGLQAWVTEEMEKYTQALFETQGGVQSLDGWMANYISSAEDMADATGEVSDKLFTAKDIMKKYTDALLFNVAAAHLDEEGQIKLAEKLGLVDSRTVSAYESVAILTEKYDLNRDGIVSNAEKTDEYIAELDILMGRINATEGELRELETGLGRTETGLGRTEEAAGILGGTLSTSTTPAVNDLHSSLMSAAGQASLLEDGLIGASGEYEARFTLFVEQVGEITLPKPYGPAAPSGPYVPPPPKEYEKRPPGWRGQHGLDMIVPSGFRGDSFGPIYASSGERVTIDTQHQQRKRKNQVAYNRVNNFYVENSAAAAMLVEQKRREEIEEIDRVI
jgi:hypothetical protein